MCFSRFCRRKGNFQYQLELSRSAQIFVCSFVHSTAPVQSTFPGGEPSWPSEPIWPVFLCKQALVGVHSRVESYKNRLSDFDRLFDGTFSCNLRMQAFLLCPRVD